MWRRKYTSFRLPVWKKSRSFPQRLGNKTFLVRSGNHLCEERWGCACKNSDYLRESDVLAKFLLIRFLYVAQFLFHGSWFDSFSESCTCCIKFHIVFLFTHPTEKSEFSLHLKLRRRGRFFISLGSFFLWSIYT